MQNVGVAADARGRIDDPGEADPNAEEHLAFDARFGQRFTDSRLDGGNRRLWVADKRTGGLLGVDYLRGEIGDHGGQPELGELDADHVAGPLVEPEQHRRPPQALRAPRRLGEDARLDEPANDAGNRRRTELAEACDLRP